MALYSVDSAFKLDKINFDFSYFWFIYRTRAHFFTLDLFLKIAIGKEKSSYSVFFFL